MACALQFATVPPNAPASRTAATWRRKTTTLRPVESKTAIRPRKEQIVLTRQNRNLLLLTIASCVIGLSGCNKDKDGKADKPKQATTEDVKKVASVKKADSPKAASGSSRATPKNDACGRICAREFDCRMEMASAYANGDALKKEHKENAAKETSCNTKCRAAWADAKKKPGVEAADKECAAQKNCMEWKTCAAKKADFWI